VWLEPLMMFCQMNIQIGVVSEEFVAHWTLYIFHLIVNDFNVAFQHAYSNKRSRAKPTTKIFLSDMDVFYVALQHCLLTK
jgi:hypothetical protein